VHTIVGKPNQVSIATLVTVIGAILLFGAIAVLRSEDSTD
jgi:hypothetical protein